MKNLNLNRRLDELPRAAWKRMKQGCILEMSERTFNAIIRGEVQTTAHYNLATFCDVLNCTVEEFMNPDHIFTDFRSEEEIAQDLNQSFHESTI